VLAQAGFGLRVSELLALRVEDVDFLRRREVWVEWQIAPGERVRTAPKTPGSRRTVPLPQVVAEALAEHVRVFPPAADGSLFTASDGRPRRVDRCLAVFAAAVSRAGLPAGTTSHDLRHHYASVLLAAGESVVAVAERLGHEDAALVLRTYGHLMPGTEDRTRRAVDDAWSADPGTDQRRTGDRP
jgi:integrase